ncbi:MAG TPA: DUF5063 domain-containing protein [Nocardioides sp.]|uniref:DUF5063 domain-containing protein n=1 Tax=Nocardioides sp. TaxID=35761 RepID=UPI002E354FDD|nr:DUF5063 domain-containing protein [Nocardioides sp.]HEX3931355.1 DUF5063 domain-containing protein [Nocardioides sp.]
MSEDTTEEISVPLVVTGSVLPASDPEDDFAVEIADQVTSFLIALKAVAAEGNPGTGISMLLLEISQLLLAGARLGAQVDFTPTTDYQPDIGPDPDLDELRLRLARLFGGVDTYSFVFDPYDPEVVESQLSDDLTQIAADLENGLRHFALGNTAEALWWWQFSYVSSWGNLGGALLNALLSIVAHDRLDVEYTGELDRVAAANEMLDEAQPT